jgi:hypothetical protein
VFERPLQSQTYSTASWPSRKPFHLIHILRQDFFSSVDFEFCLLRSEDVREKGFVVIIDMRGSTWNNIKPILKVLQVSLSPKISCPAYVHYVLGTQECFPQQIFAAYLIKPEKFWEKQKTSLGSSKYKFEVRC